LPGLRRQYRRRYFGTIFLPEERLLSDTEKRGLLEFIRPREPDLLVQWPGGLMGYVIKSRLESDLIHVIRETLLNRQFLSPKSHAFRKQRMGIPCTSGRGILRLKSAVQTTDVLAIKDPSSRQQINACSDLFTTLARLPCALIERDKESSLS
jgi:hypothetical protein